MSQPPIIQPDKQPFATPLHAPLGRSAFSPLAEGFAKQAFHMPVQQSVWYDLDATPETIRPWLGDPTTLRTSTSLYPAVNHRAAKTMLGDGFSGRMDIFAKYAWDPIEAWSEILSGWKGYDMGFPVVPNIGLKKLPQDAEGEAQTLIISPRPAAGFETWNSTFRSGVTGLHLEPVSSAAALIHCLDMGKKDNNTTNMLGQQTTGAVASLDASQLTLSSSYMPDSFQSVIALKDTQLHADAFLAAAADALQRAEDYPRDRLFTIGHYIAERMQLTSDGYRYSINGMLDGMDKRRPHLRQTLADNGLVIKG